jgi:osmotically-inducible protein OsmY
MKFKKFQFWAAAAAARVLFIAPASAQDVDDEAIARIAGQIQSEIQKLPNYGVFDDIGFAIADGGKKVILRGQASRPTLKTSAENVAKKIEGVEEVVDEIEVLPLSSMDDGIRARVYAAIYGHPSLSRYNPNRGTPMWITPGRIAAGITNDPPRGNHPIHIIVDKGNVRLEGVVDTIGDKTVAGIQANSVSGVFKVDNDLVATRGSFDKK